MLDCITDTAYHKAYRLANKEAETERIREWKKANKEHIKAWSKVYYKTNKEKIATQKREYYLKNKKHIDVRNLKYALKNAKQMQAYSAMYRVQNQKSIGAKRAVDANKNREYAKTYRKIYPDRVYETKKQYVESNRGSINAYLALRRGGKLQQTPNWLTEFDLLKMRCIYSVAAMLTRHNNEPWHVDHIIPLRGKFVSGLHTPANLQVIRGKDNMAKHNSFEVAYA